MQKFTTAFVHNYKTKLTKSIFLYCFFLYFNSPMFVGNPHPQVPMPARHLSCSMTRKPNMLILILP